MNSLETNFYAVYPEKTQTRQFNLDDSPNSYGGPGLIPVERKPWDKPYSPLLVYRWKDTKDALYNLSKSGEGSPFDGYILRYSNPVTGGWAMSTMGAHMQMLNPDHHTKAHRHTGNVIYNCAGGEGYSVIGGKKYNWKEHDIFLSLIHI